MIASVIVFVLAASALFAGTFRDFVPVTLTSDRAGLVMEPGAKVKMRGVEVGRVGELRGGQDPVALKLELFPEQAQLHSGQCAGPDPGHDRVRREVRRSDLSRRSQPEAAASRGRCCSRAMSAPRSTRSSRTWSGVLDQIDAQKLNAVLAALADGVRGQGERIGQATTDANQVLLAINGRSDTIRQDWRSFKGFSDAYGSAAQDILNIVNAASTTSTTVTQTCASAGCDSAQCHRGHPGGHRPHRLQPWQSQPSHQCARTDDQPVDEVQPRPTPVCWWARSGGWTTGGTTHSAATAGP